MLSQNIEFIIGTSHANANLHDFVSDFFFTAPNDRKYMVFPGFCDVHVHFREPGFSHKETIRTGSAAAAHGGYTAVCTMPNLNPVPDTPENLRVQTEIIEKDAVIAVYPYGAITKGEKGEELSEMEAIADRVISFSDDGRGVQSEAVMRRAMEKAASLGKIITAHCEVNSLLDAGYIHKGAYAAAHGHRGISSESEYLQIERDLYLAEQTGCAYHVCHISTKESVALVRAAKKRGINVTCETAPHYLVLDENDLRESGNFKMNPPLRASSDRISLVEGLLDGTIDMIATDHAPHTAEEKSAGLQKSPFGIVGIETAFPILYTELVQKDILSVEKLIDLIAIHPRRRFGIPMNGYTVWCPEETQTISADSFLSKGTATPFLGKAVHGVCYETNYNGKIVYKK